VSVATGVTSSRHIVRRNSLSVSVIESEEGERERRSGNRVEIDGKRVPEFHGSRTEIDRRSL